MWLCMCSCRCWQGCNLCCRFSDWLVRKLLWLVWQRVLWKVLLVQKQVFEFRFVVVEWQFLCVVFRCCRLFVEMCCVVKWVYMVFSLVIILNILMMCCGVVLVIIVLWCGWIFIRFLLVSRFRVLCIGVCEMLKCCVIFILFRWVLGVSLLVVIFFLMCFCRVLDRWLFMLFILGLYVG